MSTRANIIVKDDYGDKLYFYRHSDGYPEGALPLLEKFVNMVNSGQLRNNVNQSAGWLIVLGAIEHVIDKGRLYKNFNKQFGKGSKPLRTLMPESKEYSEWKVGSIEPTMEVHGDIEFLYTINLSDTKIKIETEEVNNNNYDEIMSR